MAPSLALHRGILVSCVYLGQGWTLASYPPGQLTGPHHACIFQFVLFCACVCVRVHASTRLSECVMCVCVMCEYVCVVCDNFTPML